MATLATRVDNLKHSIVAAAAAGDEPYSRCTIELVNSILAGLAGDNLEDLSGRLIWARDAITAYLELTEWKRCEVLDPKGQRCERRAELAKSSGTMCVTCEIDRTTPPSPVERLSRRVSRMFTVTITLEGVARTVTVEGFTYREDGKINRLYVHGGVARIGQGKARYPADVRPVRAEATTHRHHRAVVTDEYGDDWYVTLDVQMRNRPAVIVGWDDKHLVTNETDNTRTTPEPWGSDI